MVDSSKYTTLSVTYLVLLPTGTGIMTSESFTLHLLIQLSIRCLVTPGDTRPCSDCKQKIRRVKGIFSL